jgi:uncharacterized protein YbjT (DUF2867 family)
MRVLVVGATGNVGSRTVAALAERPDVIVRCAVRNPSKAPALLNQGSDVEVADFDFTRPDSWAQAVANVDRMCLITPGSFEGYHVEPTKRLIDAARDAGISHVVRQSIIWADHKPELIFGGWHRDIERHLEASGIPWTVFRPNPFMNNFINYTPPDGDGNIYAPIADGVSAYIDVRDIADSFAAVAAGEGHAGQIYYLAGPESITVTKIADAISSATGRPIRYLPVPEEAARAGLQSYGAPDWFIDGQMEAYASMSDGETAHVTDTVQSLTGHAPRSIEIFARDHAAAWS